MRIQQTQTYIRTETQTKGDRERGKQTIRHIHNKNNIQPNTQGGRQKQTGRYTETKTQQDKHTYEHIPRYREVYTP